MHGPEPLAEDYGPLLFYCYDCKSMLIQKRIVRQPNVTESNVPTLSIRREWTPLAAYSRFGGHLRNMAKSDTLTRATFPIDYGRTTRHRYIKRNRVYKAILLNMRRSARRASNCAGNRAMDNPGLFYWHEGVRDVFATLSRTSRTSRFSLPFLHTQASLRVNAIFFRDQCKARTYSELVACRLATLWMAMALWL